ncbi:MAG TPA: alkaline phosphatase [Bryobacteraceae bacterium]|nr:alkaline phosphatase [Bryobacteraceae bacterium]
MMKKLFLFAACLLTAAAGERRAKNIIVFLGDAGGIPTLHAASIHGHGAPGKLFIQQMPNIGLSETSPVGGWVTDSAAGMTAIVTGHKTKSGVISQSADAVPGKVNGAPLKTILEYAEEHGLSTGVISNVSMADATPAACYAHANHRRKYAEIVAQIANPRFGDGVDLVIGGGRKGIFEATGNAKYDFRKALSEKGYALYDSPGDVPADAKRVVALTDDRYDPAPIVKRAIEILSRNPKGYFLMVEWDMHTNNLQKGLDQAVTMDNLVRQTAGQVNSRDTLVLFTADHSFDLRLLTGKTGQPVVPAATPDDAAPVPIRVGTSHTGEEVLVAAMGPGASRVKGYMPNTQIFHIMMQAYGWKESKAEPAAPDSASAR